MMFLFAVRPLCQNEALSRGSPCVRISLSRLLLGQSAAGSICSQASAFWTSFCDALPFKFHLAFVAFEWADAIGLAAYCIQELDVWLGGTRIQLCIFDEVLDRCPGGRG